MNAHELDCKCEELGSSFQSFWMMIASGVYHEDRRYVMYGRILRTLFSAHVNLLCMVSLLLYH